VGYQEKFQEMVQCPSQEGMLRPGRHDQGLPNLVSTSLDVSLMKKCLDGGLVKKCLERMAVQKMNCLAMHLQAVHLNHRVLVQL
jgi:hypothetical protein